MRADAIKKLWPKIRAHRTADFNKIKKAELVRMLSLQDESILFPLCVLFSYRVMYKGLTQYIENPEEFMGYDTLKYPTKMTDLFETIFSGVVKAFLCTLFYFYLVYRAKKVAPSFIRYHFADAGLFAKIHLTKVTNAEIIAAIEQELNLEVAAIESEHELEVAELIDPLTRCVFTTPSFVAIFDEETLKWKRISRAIYEKNEIERWLVNGTHEPATAIPLSGKKWKIVTDATSIDELPELQADIELLRSAAKKAENFMEKIISTYANRLGISAGSNPQALTSCAS